MLNFSISIPETYSESLSNANARASSGDVGGPVANVPSSSPPPPRSKKSIIVNKLNSCVIMNPPTSTLAIKHMRSNGISKKGPTVVIRPRGIHRTDKIVDMIPHGAHKIVHGKHSKGPSKPKQHMIYEVLLFLCLLVLFLPSCVLSFQLEYYESISFIGDEVWVLKCLSLSINTCMKHVTKRENTKILTKI